MKDKIVVGVNVGFHDASAALAINGRLVSLIEQERVSRNKHAVADTPAKAVKQVITEAGLNHSDITDVAIGWDLRKTPMGRSRRFSPPRLAQMLFSELSLSEEQAASLINKVHWVDHHLAHAASGYYSLGIDAVRSNEPVALLVVDGAGEHSSTTLAVGQGNEIKILEEWPMEHSLGFYYSAASRWAGFGDWGAGKLMGLACYGCPIEAAPLQITKEGYQFIVNDNKMEVAGASGSSRDYLLSTFPSFEEGITPAFSSLYPYVPASGEEAIAYADFAATIQRSLENTILHLSERLKALTACKTVVLTGGVAMNCSMTGRLIRSKVFERVYVPPVPTDVGVALGAALYPAREMDNFCPAHIDHAYWSTGLQENSAEFEKTRRELGLDVVDVEGDQIPALAAKAVADGLIIGWAQGHGEIGERALGARSIIADPRNRATLVRLNKLKGREMWRPVAPSVLADRYDDYFEGGAQEPMRFMLAAAPVQPNKRSSIPAVTHVDGTARPQTVYKETNPRYWEFINRFSELTGVPLVCNTSFNLADEPIVRTASDALRTFARGDGFDMLFVGNKQVTKTNVSTNNTTRVLDEVAS